MYMLIVVIERYMFWNTYSNYEDAYKEMEKEFQANCSDYEDYIKCGDAGISDHHAWINDGNNHDNYDWYIIKVN